MIRKGRLMARIYGYARVSTPKQDINRQLRSISKEYPTAHILSEAYTGVSIDRPEWNKLMRTVKSDDTIIFDSVSRMSRNADEGFDAYQKLYEKGVTLIFLKEPHINTTTYKNSLEKAVPMTGTSVDYILEGINRYLLELAREQIRLAFEQSEKEVTDMHQRVREGLVTAKINGKQIGRQEGKRLNMRKAEPIKKIILSKSRDFNGTLTDREILAMLKGLTVEVTVAKDKTMKTSATISRNTYYKYKNEIIAGNMK